MPDTPVESAQSLLQDIFGSTIDNDPATKQGLINLKSIPAFDLPPPPVNGKEFTPGLIGFRKPTEGLNLSIACGKAQVRKLSLKKYIAMVENLHDKDAASIMLQNFTESDDGKGGKGQILGRINAASSAITIIQGVTGRIIRGASDIALFDVYYIDRKDLTAFYLAAKHQISNADQLETMIAAFDGWESISSTARSTRSSCCRTSPPDNPRQQSMSVQRSYGRILWRDNILGFQMVNPYGDQFFIYAEPLINVVVNAGNPVRIKRKDKKINPNAEHHPGEIFSSVVEITADETTYTKLILYLGAAETLILFNSDSTKLLEVIEEQEYIFPKNEFTDFVKSIQAMHDQHTIFTLMMRNIDVLSPND